MDPKRHKHISKFLSLVLRHEPEAAGVTLDEAGWVDVDALITGCRANGVGVSRVELDEIVATSDKQRFALSPDGTRIRANQGHSLPVELGYEPAEPPEVLFHGTGERTLPAIRVGGLLKMSRHHVHLSREKDTAQKVGQRHGRPVVLTVRTGEMHRDGHAFFVSANGVWLTESVPVKYISFPRNA